ncbi:hypothetical protein KZP23_15380 [Echinicola marina]|uniref:hypothetical protein n=1 Tax=Echinicola marina TaxID=2859768 RepID=UPI001CF7185B|nr:hypothetical protein [Echinicola marina]UCS92091.1 hypothetical protein KZP23_15380 [Echinicola marina]
MKKLIMFLPALFALLICTPPLLAQESEVSKNEILGAMNSFEGLDLSSDKKDKLKATNKNAVDDLFEIAKGNDSPEEKTKKFMRVKEDNSKIFKDILGEDKFKKYQKSVKKKLRPFKRKAKLIGFLI